MAHIHKCEYIFWSSVGRSLLRILFVLVWRPLTSAGSSLFFVTLSLFTLSNLLTRSESLLLDLSCELKEIINLIVIAHPIGLALAAERVPPLLSDCSVCLSDFLIFALGLFLINMRLFLALLIFFQVPHSIHFPRHHTLCLICRWLLDLLLVILRILVYALKMLSIGACWIKMRVIWFDLSILLVWPHTLRIALLLLGILGMLSWICNVGCILLPHQKRVIWKSASGSEPQVLPAASHLAHERLIL